MTDALSVVQVRGGDAYVLAIHFRESSWFQNAGHNNKNAGRANIIDEPNILTHCHSCKESSRNPSIEIVIGLHNLLLLLFLELNLIVVDILTHVGILERLIRVSLTLRIHSPCLKEKVLRIVPVCCTTPLVQVVLTIAVLARHPINVIYSPVILARHKP